MEHWREEPASGWRERWCIGEVWAPAISLLPPERETEERERNGDHGEVAQWWAVDSNLGMGGGSLLAGGLGLDVAVGFCLEVAASSDVGSGLGSHSFHFSA
jgi:hypothetical protein